MTVQPAPGSLNIAEKPTPRGYADSPQQTQIGRGLKYALILRRKYQRNQCVQSAFNQKNGLKYPENDAQSVLINQSAPIEPARIEIQHSIRVGNINEANVLRSVFNKKNELK